MRASAKRGVFVAFLSGALGGFAGILLAQDKETVVKNREALMKGQAKDLGSVKAYTDGKADLGQGEKGAANLTQSTKKIPEMFPPETDATDSEGKFATKPVIWSE